MEWLGSLRDASEEFRGLSVTHDMTRAEREQCKECMQEAKERTRQDASGTGGMWSGEILVKCMC